MARMNFMNYLIAQQMGKDQTTCLMSAMMGKMGLLFAFMPGIGTTSTGGATPTAYPTSTGLSSSMLLPLMMMNQGGGRRYRRRSTRRYYPRTQRVVVSRGRY